MFSQQGAKIVSLLVNPSRLSTCPSTCPFKIRKWINPQKQCMKMFSNRAIYYSTCGILNQRKFTDNTPNVTLIKTKSFHSCAQSSAYENSQYWDYSTKYGPNNWNRLWKANVRQSPIDIITKDVKYNNTLKPFILDKSPVRLNYANNGVNAGVTPQDEREVLLRGGALGDTYAFMQFHFHFGEENTCGCEHTVDGHRYAAELHIVHYNQDLYHETSEAFYGPNGLAVLGIFLDACDSYEDNDSLEHVLKSFNNILYQGDSHTSPDLFSVYELLPENVHDYYTYPGSLTTPPLTENVIWTLFREPIKISKRQQKEFTKLYCCRHDEKNEKFTHDPCDRSTEGIPQPPNICNNYRPAQPLNNRTIHSSFSPTLFDRMVYNI